ncbi:UBP43 hydrolase, partial [Vidua macroura]|nr:UBP43 hydrolase [Vidua macroura]
LQNIVSKHSSQFRGNAQHDALEFLLWLLDRMHEDLGAASPAQQSRGPTQGGLSGGRARSADPARPFARSSLTCPHCLRQSNTFDPFLCISLPIPLRQTRGEWIPHWDWWGGVDPSLGLAGGSGSLMGLVGGCGSLTGAGGRGWIPHWSGSLTRAGGRLWIPSFGLVGGSGSLTGIGGREWIPHCDWWEVVDLSLGLVGHVSLLPVPRFGPPLVLREERGVSWEQLQQNILAQLRGVLRGEVRPQGTGALFRIRLAGGSAPCTYLSPQDPRPLCHPAIDRALQLCGAGGPPHVRLTVEWDTSTKERLFGSIQEEEVQDAESVRQQQQAHGQQHSCTLDECFQLYTKEEQV